MASVPPLIVQKYGGSSLATPAHIQRAALRIRRIRESGKQIVVVASAMGNMTDHLIRLAHRTVARPPQREMDMLLSTGERVSMSLLAMALEAEGVPAISFTGSQSGIITTPDHTNARIKEIKPFRAQQELAKGKVVIIAGFQGVSENKEITTLGRGGSDTTAIALAAALGAEACEILTDVDGIFSADPRIVTQARLISECGYDEGLTLATLGAKMHPRSLEVARKFRVPVWIGPSRQKEDLNPVGTWITDVKKEVTRMETVSVKGIATLGDQVMIESDLTSQSLWELTQNLRIAPKVWQVNTHSVSLVCDDTQGSALVEGITKSGSRIQKQEPVVIVSAVGDGLGSCPDALPRFLGALASADITPINVTRSALAISAVVPANLKVPGVKALHFEFIEKNGG